MIGPIYRQVGRITRGLSRPWIDNRANLTIVPRISNNLYPAKIQYSNLYPDNLFSVNSGDSPLQSQINQTAQTEVTPYQDQNEQLTAIALAVLAQLDDKLPVEAAHGALLRRALTINSTGQYDSKHLQGDYKWELSTQWHQSWAKGPTKPQNTE